MFYDIDVNICISVGRVGDFVWNKNFIIDCNYLWLIFKNCWLNMLLVYVLIWLILNVIMFIILLLYLVIYIVIIVIWWLFC